MRCFSILLAVLTLNLSSCGLYTTVFGPPTTTIRSIQAVAELNANQNMAATVDAVFVYDSTALTLLPNKSSDWFANKAALQSALGSRIEVVSEQVAPPSIVDFVLPARHRRALTVYSYVDYVAGNLGVTDITFYRAAQIQLTPSKVVYTGQ
ncbi:hypothetical protein [Andreprevotia chitinilytica]|uniref:hypothetical protein n=1 Tax=Andreprevotia chitinilytica TaxID=396808 RepID=UPI0012EBEE39|nr:hypothetical protein [Andreprevotia chitinilytica]